MGDLSERDVATIDSTEVENHVSMISLGTGSPGTGNVSVGRPASKDAIGGVSGGVVVGDFSVLSFKGKSVVHSGEPGCVWTNTK